MRAPRCGVVVGGGLLAAWLLAGCASDRCTSEPASFQLDVSLSDPDAAARTDALLVSIEFLGRSYSRHLPVAASLGDGETSLSVELDPAPTEDFDLMVSVQALGGTSVQGDAEQVFRGHPNGCNRFALALSPSARTGDGGLADRGTDAPSADLGQPDAEAPDLALAVDLGPADQGTPPPDPPCTARVDDDVVLLYTFDEVPAFTTTVADARDVHPAFAAPLGSVVDRAPSREECGLAARFSGASYLEVPHSDEFDLSSGSIDFWFAAPVPAQRSMEALFSRDASGTARSGHTSMYRDCQGYIVVRMQRTDGTDIYRCSNAPIPPDQWAHVALNFGSPEVELYVDGDLSTNTSTTTVLWDCTTPVACGEPGNHGIDGNENPFVLGVGSHTSQEGLATPTSRPFTGQIDSFRLSRIRRSF